MITAIPTKPVVKRYPSVGDRRVQMEHGRQLIGEVSARLGLDLKLWEISEPGIDDLGLINFGYLRYTGGFDLCEIEVSKESIAATIRTIGWNVTQTVVIPSTYNSRADEDVRYLLDESRHWSVVETVAVLVSELSAQEIHSISEMLCKPTDATIYASHLDTRLADADGNDNAAILPQNADVTRRTVKKEGEVSR